MLLLSFADRARIIDARDQSLGRIKKCNVKVGGYYSCIHMARAACPCDHHTEVPSTGRQLGLSK